MPWDHLPPRALRSGSEQQRRAHQHEQLAQPARRPSSKRSQGLQVGSASPSSRQMRRAPRTRPGTALADALEPRCAVGPTGSASTSSSCRPTYEASGCPHLRPQVPGSRRDPGLPLVDWSDAYDFSTPLRSPMASSSWATTSTGLEETPDRWRRCMEAMLGLDLAVIGGRLPGPRRRPGVWMGLPLYGGAGLSRMQAPLGAPTYGSTGGVLRPGWRSAVPAGGGTDSVTPGTTRAGASSSGTTTPSLTRKMEWALLDRGLVAWGSRRWATTRTRSVGAGRPVGGGGRRTREHRRHRWR